MTKFKNTNFDLAGKTALITGGAGLLGVQHAIALTEANANVVLTDVSEHALARVASKFSEEQVDFKTMDVTKPESVRRIAEEYREAGTKIDILVNNAAIDPKVDPKKSLQASSRLENFALEQWDLQIAVGLTGSFLCSQVFGTLMSESGGGVILNVASDLSVISPDQRLYRKEGLSEQEQQVKPITYSVIKTGLIGMTRYLATYWSQQGVRANALSPGGVFTGQDEEFVQRLSQLIPAGRMAGVEEYHSAIQFLCSDASAYMNGQNIVMDGGRSVW